MGGPVGGRSGGAGTSSYSQQSTSQQATNQQTSTQQGASQQTTSQGTAYQSSTTQAGNQQTTTQEYTAGSSYQAGTQMGQPSTRGTADRKTSVPTGTRRSPTHVKSQTVTPPVGAQAVSGRPGMAGKAGAAAVGVAGAAGAAAVSQIRNGAVSPAQPAAPGSPGAVQHGPAGTPAAPSTSRITQMNAQKVQGGPVSGTTQAAEHTGIAVGQTTQNTSSVSAQKPHLRPKLRRHRLRPLRLARRHRYGRQIPVIPSDRPKALLRRRSRVRPLPARQPFIRKARSTVRQERRPRRLLRSPHGNPGPAGMLLLREVQCRQRQGSIARPGRKRSTLPQALCLLSRTQPPTCTPARQERRRETGKQRRHAKRRGAPPLFQLPPAHRRA